MQYNFIEVESQAGVGLLSHYKLLIISGDKVVVRGFYLLSAKISLAVNSGHVTIYKKIGTATCSKGFV